MKCYSEYFLKQFFIIINLKLAYDFFVDIQMNIYSQFS